MVMWFRREFESALQQRFCREERRGKRARQWDSPSANESAGAPFRSAYMRLRGSSLFTINKRSSRARDSTHETRKTVVRSNQKGSFVRWLLNWLFSRYFEYEKGICVGTDSERHQSSHQIISRRSERMSLFFFLETRRKKNQSWEWTFIHSH